MKNLITILLVALTLGSCNPDEQIFENPNKDGEQKSTDTTVVVDSQTVWITPVYAYDTFCTNTAYVFVCDTQTDAHWYTTWDYFTAKKEGEYFELTVPKGGSWYIGVSNHYVKDGENMYRNLVSTEPYIFNNEKDTACILTDFRDGSGGQNSPLSRATAVTCYY